MASPHGRTELGRDLPGVLYVDLREYVSLLISRRPLSASGPLPQGFVEARAIVRDAKTMSSRAADRGMRGREYEREDRASGRSQTEQDAARIPARRLSSASAPRRD
jgi:hypothetical protein